jgi:hypothetical protein
VTALILLAHLLAASAQPASALRIVVLQGEDSVNVIQQKSAVAPVIEVRDRNDLPVAGAMVTFTIGGNTASFAGGVQTFTIATNAAGQAAAAAISPLASGAVQINVAAAFQGQTAIATIAQTNVMTAAQAAAAAGATSAGASSGSAGGTTTAAGGAAGGGGGVSGTTIGIVGAAVAGGALAATQAGGDETAPEPQRPRTFTGPFSMLVSLTFGGCNRQEQWTGTFSITATATEPLSGSAEITSEGRVQAVTCTGGPQLGATDRHNMPATPLTGTAANLGFTYQRSNNFPPGPGPGEVGGINTVAFSFTGTLNGNEITGTLSHMRQIQGPTAASSAMGTASAAVTLR